MKTLILGATGATGKRLVGHLTEMGHEVKVMVRPTSNIPAEWNDNDRITIIKGSVSEMTVDEMAAHIADCDAVASCLGHNLSWKGIYGKPRKLVTDAVSLVCKAIVSNAPEKPVKVVLMNTAGNQNRDLKERLSIGEKMLLGIIRLMLPPHPDNEKAADHLRVNIGQNHLLVEWIVVRPDNLIDAERASEYELHPSPVRSALFNPGKTSRTNVGHFMASLIGNDELWKEWKGQMPVIYNKE